MGRDPADGVAVLDVQTPTWAETLIMGAGAPSCGSTRAYVLRGAAPRCRRRGPFFRSPQTTDCARSDCSNCLLKADGVAVLDVQTPTWTETLIKCLLCEHELIGRRNNRERLIWTGLNQLLNWWAIRTDKGIIQRWCIS